MKEHQIACITYKKYQGVDWSVNEFKETTEKSICLTVGVRRISINIRASELAK